MKSIMTAMLVLLCLILIPAGLAPAAARIVGETTGFYFSVIWNKWFEVPVWVYVDTLEMLFIGGGSVSKATAAFPISLRPDIQLLLVKCLDEVRSLNEVGRAREAVEAQTGELGSITMLIDEESGHYNGIEMHLARDRTGQSFECRVKIYDYMDPLSTTEIHLAVNQLRDLIDIMNRAPDTLVLLQKDDRMMKNTNQLNLGRTKKDDRLEEINKFRF
jgi:hypothetical protein